MGPKRLTRPNDLAEELGVPGKSLRDWLRATYPRSSAEHGMSWWLNPEQVTAARAAFRGHGRRSPVNANPRVAAPPSMTASELGGRKDWFWEGQVQAAVVRFLAADGWKIESVADTASKAHG